MTTIHRAYKTACQRAARAILSDDKGREVYCHRLAREAAHVAAERGQIEPLIDWLERQI